RSARHRRTPQASTAIVEGAVLPGTRRRRLSAGPAAHPVREIGAQWRIAAAWSAPLRRRKRDTRTSAAFSPVAIGRPRGDPQDGGGRGQGGSGRSVDEENSNGF